MKLNSATVVDEAIRRLRGSLAGVWDITGDETTQEFLVLCPEETGTSQNVCVALGGLLTSEQAAPAWAFTEMGSGAGGDSGSDPTFHDLHVNGWIRRRVTDSLGELVEGSKLEDVGADKTMTVKGNVTEEYYDFMLNYEGNVTRTLHQGLTTSLGSRNATLDQYNTPIPATTGADAISLGRMQRVSKGYVRSVSTSAVQRMDNNATHTVTGNETVTIGGNSTTTIQGDYTENIKGNYATTIAGKESYTVTGDYLVKVDGNVVYRASGNVTTYYGDMKSTTWGHKFSLFMLCQSLEIDLGLITKVYLATQSAVIFPPSPAFILQFVPVDSSYKIWKLDFNLGPEFKQVSKAVIEGQMSTNDSGVGHGKLNALAMRISALTTRTSVRAVS